MKIGYLDVPALSWQWAAARMGCAARFLLPIRSLQQIYVKFYHQIEWFCVARLLGCLKTEQRYKIGVKIQYQ